MKHLKAFGLTALAALTIMVFGASSASALDVLCENNTTMPCSQPVAGNGIITMEATTLILTSNIMIHCEKSTITLKVTKNDATNGVTGDVTGWSWTNCRTTNLGIFNLNCAITTKNLPYHVELVTGAPVFASLTIKSGGTGPPGATMVCGTFLNCAIQDPDFTLPLDSGSPASVTANEVPLEEVGEAGGCPSEIFWDAKYVAESPTSSLFVRSS